MIGSEQGTVPDDICAAHRAGHLSTRTCNQLLAQGVTSLTAVSQMSDVKLLHMRNVGIGTVREIREVCGTVARHADGAGVTTAERLQMSRADNLQHRVDRAQSAARELRALLSDDTLPLPLRQRAHEILGLLADGSP